MSENNFNQGGYVQAQSNGLAVASLVLGILSILFVWIPFIGLVSWILAPIGLVLGLVALIVPGFHLAGFWTAVGAALLVSLVSWLASSVIGANGRVEVFTRR